MKRVIALAVTSILAAGALTIGVAGAAQAADVPTTIVFTTEPATAATFGSDWELAVRVTSELNGQPVIVSSSDGTVDFLVEGEPGAYVDDAKIYPGGVAYFTQPSTVDPLGVGEHTVTAVFTPAAGSDFVTSKTKKSVMLSITALTITPSVSIVDDPAVVSVPTVRTSIAGSFVEENGAPPSGTWTVTGTDSSGAEAFTISADQPTQAAEGSVGVLDIPIESELEPGETFTVTAVFAPDASVAPGLEFEDAAAATFTTRELTAAEVLSSRVSVALWVSILNGFLLIALIIGLVWLIGAWWRGRVPREKTPAAVAEPSTAALPGVAPSAAIGAGSRNEETTPTT